MIHSYQEKILKKHLTKISQERGTMNESTLREPLSSFINLDRRGWINVGKTRMALIDIFQGIYKISTVFRNKVGENAPYVIYQIAKEAATSFHESLLEEGSLKSDGTGFEAGVNAISEAGFGDFQIQELDWERGWARILSRDSFEGWAYLQNQNIQNYPVCDYSRGALLSLMRNTHRFAGTGLSDYLNCAEISCIGRGNEFCEFIIGDKKHLEQRGFEITRERKSLQEELRELIHRQTTEIDKVTQLQKKIIENAPVAIFTLDKEGQITSSNPAHLKLADAPLHKVLGLNWIKAPMSIYTGLSEHLKRGLEGEEFELINFPYCTYKGNRQLIMTVKGIPLKDPGGKIEGLLCIIEDTTEKAKIVKRIEYLKEFNENIIQSMSNGIMVLDRDLKVQTWNRAMEQMFGLRSGEVMGKPFQALVKLLLPRGWLNRLKRVMETGEPFEEKGFKIRTPRKGMITFNYKILPFFDERREIIGLILLHEDISAQEKMEIKYQNLFEKAEDGIFAMDLKGNFISVNEKAQKIFGQNREELIGRDFCSRVSSDFQLEVKRRVKAVRKADEVGPYEIEVDSRDGSRIPVEVTVTGIREDKKIIGLQVIMRDIRERKRMQSQLVQASKMSALGQLASGVAHEINNPLATIDVCAQESLELLVERKMKKIKGVDEFIEMLETIKDQAERCKVITQNLLNFARKTEFKLEKANLNDLVERMIALIEFEVKAQNKQILRSLASELPPIHTDPIQLQQVFLNILNNAVEATDKQGRILVKTWFEDGRVAVSFSDNGKGIPPENLDKIFTPFFTTKPLGKGTGLGLSICYGIIEKLNGKIDVKSKLGNGTTFTIYIPTRS
jgi:PAS domain S-box-containing protein